MGVSLLNRRSRFKARATGRVRVEQDARDAPERELEQVRRERRIARRLTLAELVETYLAQHDVQPVTIEKLRYLLSKATAVFGDRKRRVDFAGDRGVANEVVRTRRPQHAIKLLDALNAPWTSVDAAWTTTERAGVSPENESDD